MALATLSKGVIGAALPAMVFVAYSVTTWDWKVWTRLRLFSGIALYLLVTAPWFVLVAQRNPEFLEFFFIHEHLQRFTQDAHSQSRTHLLLCTAITHRHTALDISNSWIASASMART